MLLLKCLFLSCPSCHFDRCSLPEDAKSFFDQDTGVLEVPLNIQVADQVGAKKSKIDHGCLYTLFLSLSFYLLKCWLCLNKLELYIALLRGYTFILYALNVFFNRVLSKIAESVTINCQIP